MLKITDDILEAWDRGDTTALVLLDFTKAFDLVDHKLFDTKCQNYYPESGNLIRSFLVIVEYMAETTYVDFFSTVVLWKYFLNSEDAQTAKRKLCKSIIKRIGCSTKGLYVHLNTKHKIDTKLQGSKDSSRSDSEAAPTTSTSHSSAGSNFINLDIKT
nr:unnamed protein product [Callosobruchus analis]